MASILRTSSSLLVALFLVFCLAACSAQTFNFVSLEYAAAGGAVCLDGSPYGYYLLEGTGSGVNSWIFYIEGGGWCYGPQDCATRANTTLGSSKGWSSTLVGFNYGPYSLSNQSNPDFYNFNMVFLPYCDGASFSGNADEPVTVGTQQIYFRGLRILDAVIADLLTNQNLANAENVLLSGCSAGGLATFLHADYFGSFLPASAKYGAMPGSGFFLFHDNAIGLPVYPDQMQSVFQMQNLTNGVNSNCIAAMQPEDQWKCVFAQNSYAYTKSSMFPLNSFYDSWQTVCIETSMPVVSNPYQNGNCSAISDWGSCVSNIATCNVTQIQKLNSYQSSIIMSLQNSTTLNKPGNGAFFDACYNHCEFQGLWNNIIIDGVTMQQAVHNWWTAPPNTPSLKLTYIDCTWTETSPYMCNPTC